MDALAHAKFFATTHHILLRKPMQMYGQVPYTHHLEAVERILREFDEVRMFMLVGAWLHDIIEDTDVKRRDVVESFGEQVGDLVFAVTSEEGANRKIRNALTYPKIRAAGPDAVRLKLADRIANVQNGGDAGSMYVKEHPDFRHALFSAYDVMNHAMWARLDAAIKELS